VKRVYVPRVLGVEPQGPGKPHGKWIELLVTGRDEIGGLAKLTALLAERNINLVLSGGYYMLASGIFVWTTFIDLTHSKSSSEDLVRDLERLDFVSRAEAAELDDVEVDRFLFPVVIGGYGRGLLMHLSSLIEMEIRLTDMLGSAGSVLMFEEGKTYAKKGIRDLLKDSTESEPRRLLDACAAWGRAMGWGVFSNDVTKLEVDGTVTVTVGEPPNSLIPNHESHFFDGVVAGGAEFALKRKVNVTSSKYDEPTRTLRVVLQASA
jgi:predicted amino acid-binding ACT domain protein